MADDFLNIWVVVHDKATKGFETLEHKIKGVDDATKNLENHLSKLDSQQAKSANVFLNAAKNVDIMTQNLRAQAEARKKAAKEEAEANKIAEKAAKDQEKRANSFLQTLQRLSRETLAEQRRLNASRISEDAKTDREIESQAEKSYKNVLGIIKKADSERESIRRQNEAREVASQKRLGAHWAKYYDDMNAAYRKHESDRQTRQEDATKRFNDSMNRRFAGTLSSSGGLGNLFGRLTEADDGVKRLTQSTRENARANDDNAKHTTRLSEAINSFSHRLRDNNKESGTFYLRVAGLRLSITGLLAAMPPLIGGLTDLAGLLVAVGAAAGVAAGAIGGAMVAAVAQATPVIGLLVVAFKQLFDVFKIASDQEKQAQQVKDQAGAKSLQAAQRANQEAQAQLQLANAQRTLIQAREDALRQIDDLNRAEQEALLNSRRATLGLIGSSDALGKLVAGGGSALDIANAQADEQAARLGLSGARSSAGRASADAARARRQGVAGNPQVIAAQQNLIQQQRDLVLSQREYNESLKHTNQAQNDLAKRIAQLTPAQALLLDSVKKLKAEYKADWLGITDPIIKSFTGIIDGITKAMKDKDIQNAFKLLSGEVGRTTTTATSFFGTPEAKRLFIQVMKDARENLPLIASILRDISEIFLNIAVAAGPFLHVILKGISDFFKDFAQTTSDRRGMAEFFAVGQKSAEAFWGVITGILDILVALGTNGGVATGITLVGQLADYLHSIGTELKNNPKGVGGFFDGIQIVAQDLGSLLDHLIRAFIEIEQTGVFDRIVQVIDKLLLPVLSEVLVVAAKIAVKIADFALENPDLAKTVAIIAGMAFVGLKLFGVIQKLIGALEVLTIIEEGAWAAALGPIALVIAAIVALGVAVYLLDKKFHFLQPTLEWLKNTFTGVIDYIAEHWRGLGRIFLLLSGPIGWITLLIIENFGKIVKAAQWMAEKLIAFFQWVGGTSGGKILVSVFKNVVHWLDEIVKFFDKNDLTSIIGGVFNAIVTIVTTFVDKLAEAYGLLQKIVTLGGLLDHGGSGKQAPAGMKYQYNNRTHSVELVPDGSGGGGGGGTTSTAASGSNDGSVTSNIPVLKTAASAIGVPYKYGGFDLASGVDCSGLVYAAAKANGIDLPRTSQEQAKRGYAVAKGDLQPGDLLFYNTSRGPNSHEAIYAGNGNMLVASKTGTNVHVLPLDPNYNTARRIMAFTAGIKKSSGSGSGGGSPAKPATTSTNTTGRGQMQVPAVSQVGGKWPTGAQAYLPAIRAAAAKYGVRPELLAAQIQQESSFNPYAKSSAGATGISQFMPGTAAGLGIDPTNPNQSIDAQAKMMSRLIKKYGGDEQKALAAYNAGEGAVAKYGGVPPYTETQNYIKAIKSGESRFPGLATSPVTTTTTKTAKKLSFLPDRGARLLDKGNSQNSAFTNLQASLNSIPNYLTLSIQDVLDQAKIAFKNKSKAGGTALITVLNRFGGIFEQMAKTYDTLLARQKHRLIANRYRVSGASGNTSVEDVGSDLGDARQHLSDLGFDRDFLLGRVNQTQQAIGQVSRELSQTKNKNRRGILQGVLNDLKAKYQEFQDALDQNTLDIVQAQKDVLAARIAEVQNWVDAINNSADSVLGTNNAKISIAKLTGLGKELIPAYISSQIDALTSKKIGLQGALGAAVAIGDPALIKSITDALTEIDVTITQAIADRFQAYVDATDEIANRQNTATNIRERLNSLGGRSFSSLVGQGGVLQQRGADIRSQIAAQTALLSSAQTPADYQATIDRITELNTQLAENTDEIRENSENVRQARVDQIKNLGSFRGGINSGGRGLLEALAEQSGTFDTPGLIKLLSNQGNNLRTTGAGLRGELASQFGINLSTDPRALLTQLSNTDFGAMEFGMNDNTKATFEDLINSIIDNATATVQNTTELQKANDQSTIQDWSSSLWSTFRDALFTGNGGILAGIPQAATGAHIMSSGLINVHAGETIVPAGVTSYNGGGITVHMPIDNRGEGDVDPLAVSKRLAFELANRGK